jgi:hypothetical protein
MALDLRSVEGLKRSAPLAAALSFSVEAAAPAVAPPESALACVTAVPTPAADTAAMV